MVARMVALIDLVRSNPRTPPTLRELAEQHGCCERTIRRDLEAIELYMPVPWRRLQGE